MSLLQINTAVPLAEPLLEQRRRNSDDEDARQNNRRSVLGPEHEHEHEHELQSRTRTKFVAFGAVTGFLVQVISLGAYACILQYQGMPLIVDNDDVDPPELYSNSGGGLSMDGFFQHTIDDDGFLGTQQDRVVYTILSVLTQIDLVVYALIWVAFTCTMTRNGMNCIRSRFFAESVVHRRYVFVLGVCFLVGIVLGAFGAWSAVDIYLGLPIPFEPIVLTVVIDLALCYLMVYCFDLSKQQQQQHVVRLLSTTTTTTTRTISTQTQTRRGEEDESEIEFDYDENENEDEDEDEDKDENENAHYGKFETAMIC